MYYAKNRKRAQTTNTRPSLTDQSQAKDTDINVIVGKFIQTGRVPGATTQPMGGDFSELPTDLRGFIETAKTLRELRYKLPVELMNYTPEQIIGLTSEQLSNILSPKQPAGESEAG